MRFAGKTAVVTGAARGIGAATAARLAAEGARVLLADLDATGAAASAERIRQGGGQAVAGACDVGRAGDIEALFARAKSEFGRLDILVANAGVARVAPFLEHTLEDWELVLRVNLTGVFLCGQAAARLMVESKTNGAIVNIASISGQRGGSGRAAYGASKAGVIGLTKVMAVDLAGYGIRVNAIAPGPIETEMVRTAHNAAQRAAYHRLTPLARYGSEQEIASAALFLASNEASYVTGHTLNVDGGFASAGLMADVRA